MKDKVLQIVADIAKKSPDELQDHYNDTKFFNSLTRVEIIMTLEDEFNIEYSDEEIASMNTPFMVVKTTLERIDEA